MCFSQPNHDTSFQTPSPFQQLAEKLRLAATAPGRDPHLHPRSGVLKTLLQAVGPCASHLLDVTPCCMGYLDREASSPNYRLLDGSCLDAGPLLKLERGILSSTWLLLGVLPPHGPWSSFHPSWTCEALQVAAGPCLNLQYQQHAYIHVQCIDKKYSDRMTKVVSHHAKNGNEKHANQQYNHQHTPQQHNHQHNQIELQAETPPLHPRSGVLKTLLQAVGPCASHLLDVTPCCVGCLDREASSPNYRLLDGSCLDAGPLLKLECGILSSTWLLLGALPPHGPWSSFHPSWTCEALQVVAGPCLNLQAAGPLRRGSSTPSCAGPACFTSC
ncbi:hypothetical protein LR48_Vigan08g051800 [Vigna angularis]|uniref:Uncharacterized protein n=1 Tax=Phaseolus angularis TaxID=3914 RepID=A0A0L9V3Y2_PHAAN|nr:hypothetical protein LR48_Vigan08g051800 [Vigna angularis]